MRGKAAQHPDVRDTQAHVFCRRRGAAAHHVALAARRKKHVGKAPGCEAPHGVAAGVRLQGVSSDQV